jgi:excisionase family DNA binding protein
MRLVTTIPATSATAPEATERRGLAAVKAFLGRHESGAARLVSADGEEVEIPAQLIEVLRHVASALAKGSGVEISTLAEELSTAEAARALGMSRPTLVRLLEADEIPSRKVGSHRRVLTDDVLHYRRRQLQRQRKAYEDLMLESDALGLDDDG